MGMYAIKMPDIGEGIAEVEVVAWHVKPGEAVAEDQAIADVMTDKATVEIPSPVSGVVHSLGCEPGTLMSVGAVLLRLEVEGQGNERDIAASTASVRAESVGGSQSPASQSLTYPHASDAVVEAPEPIEVPHPASTHSSQRITGERPLASPAVRQRAWDLGIDLQFVNGSGSIGRITHEDLDVYLAKRGGTSPSMIANAYAKRDGEVQVAVIGLRRKIATKMQEAKRRIPHFSYVEEIDVTELESMRAVLNRRDGAKRSKLTLLPLLVRAIVLALREFPQMNARFDDDAGVVTRYLPVHLGIATQTDSGLMVPVVRHAESLDIWACASEIARLAEAARTGKAAREELSGSTLTISSLGALGGIVTTPVINHPEVAIIGVNRIVERPVFIEGQVVGRKLMNLSSSFDHRVVDGMDAAQFIQAIRALMETPALLFVE